MWNKKNSLVNRVTSGAMACMMAALTVMNPLATLPVYATQNLIDLDYKSVAKEDVEIYVQSFGESFEPGSDVEMKITIQNNTDKTLTKGGLSWRDNKDVLEDKAFVLLDDQDTEEEISEIAINEKGVVTNITLEPGAVYEVGFTATVDSSLELYNKRTIGFFFGSENAEDADEKITRAAEFDFTTGLVTLLPVEFEDDVNEVAAGTTGSMTLRLALDSSEYVYDVTADTLASDSNAEEEATDSDADEEAEVASGSDAEEAEVASDSDAEEEIATDSNSDEEAETATDSNTDEDVDVATDSDSDEEEDEDEDDEYQLDLDKINFDVVTYGVEFKDVAIVNAVMNESMNEVATTIEYSVDTETEIGSYFGKVGAEVKLDGKSYYATQGFEVVVVESEQKLTAAQLAEVQSVIDLIAQLPTMDEYFVEIEKFFLDDDTMDEEGFNAYIYELAKIAIPAFKAYQALSDEQKALIPAADVEKLEFIYGLCSDVTLDVKNLTEDEAYIASFVITGFNTGTDPFDTTAGPGNDTSAKDTVIRSFDTLAYTFEVETKVHDGISDVFDHARVRFEFVLPLDSSQAEFDLSSMGWVDQTEGFKPTISIKTRTIDGKEVSCQVLSCYKELLTGAGSTSVIPGKFVENVAIKVKMVNNGVKIAPIFSAALHVNQWDGTCETHKKVEKITLTPCKLNADGTIPASGIPYCTASAAPKYNVQIATGFNPQISGTYDFSTGNDKALNKTAYSILGHKVEGRIYTIGVTLQLYNDSASKGMRGVELPTGDITFDIVLDSKFAPVYDGSEKAGTEVSVIDNYLPLVWSYDGNSNGANQDARDISITTYGRVYGSKPATPGNKIVTSVTNAHNSCYDGGTWTAVQNGKTISFTVKDYQFNGIFPNTGIGPGDDDQTYLANVGCFSAAELYIIQPFKSSSNGKSVLDDFSTGGDYKQAAGTTCSDGSFNMTLNVTNLRATSVTGQELAIVSDNSNQENTKDDYIKHEVNLKRPGAYENRNLYTLKGQASTRDIFGLGENATGTCSQNGNDWATIGSEIGLMVGGYAQTQGDDGNKMCAGKWLLKFDPEALELVNATSSSNTSYYDFQYLYAVKKDGSAWASDQELKETPMANLCYFKTIEEANAAGTIVGYLVEAWPKNGNVAGIPAGIVTTYFGHNARVKNDSSLIDRRFIITEESVIWYKDAYLAAGSNVPSLLNTSYANLPIENITSKPWRPNGYYLCNTDTGNYTHNGGYCYGDTLRVIGYKATITKSLAQRIPDASGNLTDTVKNTYNLDSSQRIVDFILTPSVKYDGMEEGTTTGETTTITIVDTLPEHLHYRTGSAYLGGTYEQSSINGGTQGNITGGTSLPPTTITTNSAGAQVLTWIIPNVEVGSKLPVIYYSADIGTPGIDSTDVKVGTTNQTNTAAISATLDNREHQLSFNNYAEVGLILQRGRASSYGKYSTTKVVEPDGVLNYVVYYDNNSETAENDIYMLDTMPWNKYFGNDFTGNYTISSWSFKGVKDNFDLYYTTDKQYCGKTLNEIDETVVKGWTKVDDPSSTVLVNKSNIVAWALNGKLASGDKVKVYLSLKLNPGVLDGESNHYRNTFSSGDTITTTDEYTVVRSLEGLVWHDQNADGIRNSSVEPLKSGVKVTLMKLKAGGDATKLSDYEEYHYKNDSSLKVVSVETGNQISVFASDATAATSYEQGRYKFKDLPAGTFAVKFSDGTFSILDYKASPMDQGTGADADYYDSDATAEYDANGKLSSGHILGIEMKAVADMVDYQQESKYHDFGLTNAGSITIQKIVAGNLGDWQKEFDFTISVNNGVYTDYNVTSGDAAIAGDGTFTLAHGKSVTVGNIPKDASIVITEVNDDYTAAIKVGETEKNDEDDSDTSAKITLNGFTDGITIVFTNTKYAIVDTGILLDSAPYALTLAIVFGGIAIYVINKRKKEDDLD